VGLCDDDVAGAEMVYVDGTYCMHGTVFGLLLE